LILKNNFLRNETQENEKNKISISRKTVNTKTHEKSYAEDKEGNIVLTLTKTKKQELEEKKILIPRRNVR
jgi:hypothetical protein